MYILIYTFHRYVVRSLSLKRDFNLSIQSVYALCPTLIDGSLQVVRHAEHADNSKTIYIYVVCVVFMWGIINAFAGASRSIRIEQQAHKRTNFTQSKVEHARNIIITCQTTTACSTRDARQPHTASTTTIFNPINGRAELNINERPYARACDARLRKIHTYAFVSVYTTYM